MKNQNKFMEKEPLFILNKTIIKKLCEEVSEHQSGLMGISKDIEISKDTLTTALKSGTISYRTVKKFRVFLNRESLESFSSVYDKSQIKDSVIEGFNHSKLNVIVNVEGKTKLLELRINRLSTLLKLSLPKLFQSVNGLNSVLSYRTFRKMLETNEIRDRKSVV